LIAYVMYCYFVVKDCWIIVTVFVLCGIVICMFVFVDCISDLYCDVLVIVILYDAEIDR
jgi:hypothetical protein